MPRPKGSKNKPKAQAQTVDTSHIVTDENLSITLNADNAVKIDVIKKYAMYLNEFCKNDGEGEITLDTLINSLLDEVCNKHIKNIAKNHKIKADEFVSILAVLPPVACQIMDAVELSAACARRAEKKKILAHAPFTSRQLDLFPSQASVTHVTDDAQSAGALSMPTAMDDVEAAAETAR